MGGNAQSHDFPKEPRETQRKNVSDHRRPLWYKFTRYSQSSSATKPASLSMSKQKIRVSEGEKKERQCHFTTTEVSREL